MIGVGFPGGFRLERLRREHPRRRFRCGEDSVDDWLRDCWEAGKTFAFVAVILDCVNDAAKEFYQHWDFQQLPGHPDRLFLSAKHLDAMMQKS